MMSSLGFGPYELKCLTVDEEAVIADVYPEPAQLQGRPSSRVAEEEKEAQVPFISASLFVDLK